MGNYNKWDRNEVDKNPNTPINVVLFVSRNKDNKELQNFKERRNAFVTTRDKEQLLERFQAFVRQGQPGEMSRMYMSVNPRSNKKTQKALLHQLIDEEYNMVTIPQRIAAIAAKKENAEDSQRLKWLFDFDPIEGYDTEELSTEFIDDILYFHNKTRTKGDQPRPEINIEAHKTPNGCAIVVDQRFDTSELLTKWDNVELKRDDLLCVAWDKKTKED